MDIKVVGIDIAKWYFQIHAVDSAGNVVLKRKITRDGFLELLSKLPSFLFGLEAGSGSRHLAREIGWLEHDVRLMPPRFVRPYMKTTKNDAADAEAWCEAVQPPNMRFLPVKSVEQQTVLALHRVRDYPVRQRTGTMNALRGHLAEHGSVAPLLRGGLNSLMQIVESGDEHGFPPPHPCCRSSNRSLTRSDRPMLASPNSTAE